MTELPAYALGLLCAIILAIFTGWRNNEWRWQLWRVAGVIAINWFIGLLYTHNTGNPTPWAFNIFIDSAAAFVVMFHPAGRVQSYIGLFYALQIAGHISFGGRRLMGYHADPVFYYDAITIVAWGQLVAIGMWAGGIWGKSLLHRFRDRGHAVDRRQGAQSSGKTI